MTQEELLGRIPCFSTGRPKNDRLLEIRGLLMRFKYGPEHLKLVAEEVEQSVKHYGHAGAFFAQRLTRKRGEQPIEQKEPELF